MDHKYWLKRWESGNTRFNEEKPHRFLIKHFQRLKLKPTNKIFVPLCGASIDMSWLLAQKQTLLGVEISPIAINKFIQQQKSSFAFKKINNYTLYKNKMCQLYQGNLFNLNKNHVKQIDLIFDRGCFTAMPPENMRKKYISWLLKTLPSHTSIFLITLEHNNQMMNEPPFSVNTPQLSEYFSDYFLIKRLEREEITNIKPHWQQRGVKNLYECAHILKRYSR